MRWQFLNSPRVQGAVLAIALAVPLFSVAQGWWLNYWILMDGQTATAQVTELYWGGHGKVNYRYAVAKVEYTGHSIRNWRDARYSRVGIGEQCPVFFSASHPQLSVLYYPQTVVDAWPMALIILLLEACAVATLINPQNRWALRFGSRQSASSDGPPVR